MAILLIHLVCACDSSGTECHDASLICLNPSLLGLLEQCYHAGTNGPFSADVTPMRKFGYYSVNQAWGGNRFNLMYYVYGEILTVYYSSACSSAFVRNTRERLTQLIVRRVCFLLPFVALPYDFPRPSYASTKFTRSFQNDLPPSPRRFSVSTKVSVFSSNRVSADLDEAWPDTQS